MGSGETRFDNSLQTAKIFNMRRLGYSLLCTSFILTLVQVFIYRANLPDPVASHFGAHGHADGWMPKSSMLFFHIGLQAVMAACLVGIARLGQYLPDSLLNMPNRDYWLKGDRRRETLEYTEALLTLIAGLTAVLLLGTFQLVYQANMDGTQKLAIPWAAGLLVAYLCSVVVLITRAVFRFSTIPKVS